MNSAISIDAPLVANNGEEVQTIGDFIEDRPNPFEPHYDNCDLSDRLIESEDAMQMTEKLAAVMTPLERKIYCAYAEDQSYRDIAASTGVKPKAVDNGMTRIRKKASAVYGEHRGEKAPK